MTVEEIEVIVTAKVEGALRELKKVAPAVAKVVRQVQEDLKKIDTRTMTNKIQQATQFIKRKMQDMKRSNTGNELTIKVNNREANKQISQIQKEIDSLQKKISSRELKLNITNKGLDKIRYDTKQEVIKEMPDAGNKKITQETYRRLNNDINYTSLVKESDKLNSEIIKYNTLLNSAKGILSEEAEQTKTTQNGWGSFFNTFAQKIGQVIPKVTNMKSVFKGLPKITQHITNGIKGMGKGLKDGLCHILKYVGTFFSLRNMYSILSNSANTWLSSQNNEAQQMSANIEYMKYAMGSVFAPVIEYVINLVYQLMKAIQSLVYAFSGINIFAKATASSMNETVGSAKQTSKSLAGVHSEINNVSENNNNGGNSSVSPSMDLSQMDTQMSPFAQKLHDFFKPLIDSWNTYGTGLIEQIKITASQVGSLISSVWGSFENIITNETIYSILENILGIIGNIAEIFSNAWNYNGNGDAIVQNLANAFNNLLTAINNVVKSEGFQEFLKNCSEKFKIISEKLASINWQPLMDTLETVGLNIGTIALNILSGLTDVFKWLVENPIVAEILLAIAVAIGGVSTALTIWTAVQTALDAVLWTSPITWIIAAIVALIAVIVLCVIHWEEIKTVVSNAWETIKNAVSEAIEPIKVYLTELWQKVSEVFEGIWEIISTILGFIWNMFSTVFKAIWNIVSPIINAIWQIISTTFQVIWNIISTILGSIWNIFSQIFNWIWQLVSKIFNWIWESTSKVFQEIWDFISPIMNKIWETIKFALGKIQEIWSNIWNTISKVVSNIWNGIWGTIKNVINSILGGIEGFVNGTIKGINKLLSGISSVANAVGSLIGLDPINLQINTISLPRLAKGGVIDNPTIALMGEYSGARSNPEIVTPQNIMAETFRNEMTDILASSGNNNRPIRVQINWGTRNVVDEIIDGINEKTRQTGKAQIKVTYDY